MASVIFTNARVMLTSDTDDLSAYVTRARLTRQKDLHDDTRMGHTAHSRVAGLEDWSVELELLQAFSTAEATIVDSILNAKIGQKFTIAIRPDNAARSASNPEYSGLVVLESYTPMDGAVGDLLKSTVPLRSAGNLSRVTTSS
jgi:hypothetical protein